MRLGKGGKGAWIRPDGPRTKHGYRDIELLDKPLRTEAAIVAALTPLEASVTKDADFERLREELLGHVEAHPELRRKDLQEVLDEPPRGWFSDREVELNEELERIANLLLPVRSTSSRRVSPRRSCVSTRLRRSTYLITGGGGSGPTASGNALLGT